MMPYSLVYGTEGVTFGIEDSVITKNHTKWLCQEDNARLRMQELETLDEKRLEKQQRNDAIIQQCQSPLIRKCFIAPSRSTISS